MTQINLSRRKFMATSSAVAASIVALNVNQTPKTLAQAKVASPNGAIQLTEKIAPSGVVQNYVTGELKEELTQLTRLAATNEYEALARGKNLVAASSNTPERHQKINQHVANVHTSMAENGLRYSNYTQDFQVEGVWAERNTASVVWTEKVIFNLAGDRDPDAPQISFETKTHLTSLRKDGADWYIEYDDENFGIAAMPFDPHQMPDRITEQPASVEQQHKVHLPLIQSSNLGELVGDVLTSPAENNISASSVLGYYSRAQAAAYAQQYGSSGGMDGYRDYGNNCTNFVSRCLRAGGWTDLYAYYKSTDAWYYSWQSMSGSYTWVNCIYWYWFTLNQQRGTRLYNIWDMWAGDVLLYDFNKDGWCDHAAICHYRSNWNGTIYMAQHTNNYAWKSLNEVVAGRDWWFYPFNMKTNF